MNDIYPPLDLCQLIPDGDLAFTQNSWCTEWNKDEQQPEIISYSHVVRTQDGFSVMDEQPDKKVIQWMHKFFPHCHVCSAHYPAPTLQEVMEALAEIDGCINPTIFFQAGMWIADCAWDATGTITEEDKISDEVFYKLEVKSHRDKSPVCAALKLYLELTNKENCK